MKRIALELIIVWLFFFNCSSNNIEGKYGNELTLTNVTHISAILEEPKEFENKKVQIKGTISDVCKMKGCWMEIAGDKEFEQLRVKVDDGVMVFPLTAIGKKATVEGTFTIIYQSIEQQIEQGKHHAEETGQTFDPSTITGPSTVYQLNVEGAHIHN